MVDEKDEFAKDEPEFQYIYSFSEREDVDFHPVLVVHTKEEFLNTFVVLRDEDNVGVEAITSRGELLSVVLSCSSISFVYLVEPLGDAVLGMLAGVLQGLQRLRSSVLRRDPSGDTYSLHTPEENMVPGRDRVIISGWQVKTKLKAKKNSPVQQRWCNIIDDNVYDLLPVLETTSYESALRATEGVLSGEAPEPRDLVRRAWSARHAVAGGESVRVVPKGPPPAPGKGSVADFLTRKADREKTKRNNHDVPASPVKQMSKSDDEALDALMLLFFPTKEKSEEKAPEVKVESQPEPLAPPEAAKPPEQKRRKILRVHLV